MTMEADEVNEIVESCGCVLCDLAVPVQPGMDGIPVHRVRPHVAIACTAPLNSQKDTG